MMQLDEGRHLVPLGATRWPRLTEQGRAVRQQVVGFFTRGEVDHEPVDEKPAAAPDGGGNTSPRVPEGEEALTA